jgi:hypothetical protein
MTHISCYLKYVTWTYIMISYIHLRVLPNAAASSSWALALADARSCETESSAIMTVGSALHTLPITERPSTTWLQTVHGILFAVLFDLGVLLICSFQVLFLLPLLLLPSSWSRYLYEEGVRYTKGCTATLLSESHVFSWWQ